MAILHYQISRLDHSWVVSCEAVPIDVFEARKPAVEALMKLADAAKTRGDQVVLRIDRAPAHATADQPTSE